VKGGRGLDHFGEEFLSINGEDMTRGEEVKGDEVMGEEASSVVAMLAGRPRFFIFVRDERELVRELEAFARVKGEAMVERTFMVRDLVRTGLGPLGKGPRSLS
jgi:hypothetical protein